MSTFRLDDALKIYKRNKHLRPKTVKDMDSIFRVYMSPYWEDRDILEITSEEMYAFRNWLIEGRNLCPSYVNLCMGKLKTLLNNLNRMGYAEIKIPKIEPIYYDCNRTRILTEDEARELLLFLGDVNPDWHDIALLALSTGMRLQEILNLKGENFSAIQKRITLLVTKTKRTRFVPLRDETVALLKSYGRKRNEWFFPSPLNRNLPRNNACAFYHYVKLLGLNDGVSDTREKVVFHTLRHTFATWLIQRGVPVPVVSNLLGHTNIQMTQRYTHIAMLDGYKAIEVLPNLD